MIRTFLSLMILFWVGGTLPAQLLSPDEFLPHNIGETFTPHYMLVDYVHHVAANSPNVEVTEYGRTNEKRPLLLAFVSTPENLQRLEAIRENNLRRAGVLEGETREDLDLAIVWLSYSVHGNEAAGSEASMPVLHALADPENARTQAWLQNTLVILDPSINPDGYSRYTHWYRRVAPTEPNVNTDSWEHREPWPGGRVNHYLFDLNRDWAWQTQVESRQRLKRYHQWLPHVHVDLHEQGYNSPYYFAPAARPFHPYITQWQRDFQTTIGKNNARYFDEQGWLYFTKQVFDLFYPSYGDTYPTFNGAIGMTYEQGGSGFAGRAIVMENNDTLTLADRVAHHRTTSLATIETASKNAGRMIEEFGKFYDAAINDPAGSYRTYIIRGDNHPGRLRAFAELLDRNHIRYGSASATPALQAYNFASGETERLEVSENDLVISVRQPMGRLAQILLEPAAELEDSLTYDITAWSLPYAYGLEAYATSDRIILTNGSYSLPEASTPDNPDRPYAFIGAWNSLADARFLSALLREGMVVRTATRPFRMEGVDHPEGSLIIARADNYGMGERFFRRVRELAGEMSISLVPVSSGYSESGPDIGSGDMEVITGPRIAVASGDGVSSNGFGQVWYYFEQDLGYPVSIMPDNDIAGYDLDKYDVLILPEGRYRLSDSGEELIRDWVSAGGHLIAIGSALSALENVDRLGLRRKDRQGEEPDSLIAYTEMQRERVSEFIPGAIFKVKMDPTHPLGYGLGDTYFSLKTGSSAYELLQNGWNVGSLGDELMVSGFAGVKAKENLKNSLVFGVEGQGRGNVTYLVDNPLFRAFWENGKFLFSNAVFMVR